MDEMLVRRWPSVLVALLLAAVPIWASSHPRQQGAAPGAEGVRLLHEVQKALGGATRLAAVVDFEETIEAQAWDAAGTPLGSVRKRTRWMRTPNLLRLDQRGARGTYVLFFDGPSGSGWELLPDLQNPDPYRTTGKAVPLVGGELHFAEGYLSGFPLNQWLADQRPGYQVTSPAQNVLRIQNAANATEATEFTLDPATKLPSKSTSVSLADPDHPVPAEMRYAAWTSVDGIRFPSHEINFHSGVKRGEITSAAIRVNRGLSRAALETKPSGVEPDLPHR